MIIDFGSGSTENGRLELGVGCLSDVVFQDLMVSESTS
ncbi:hypothetical protein SLEP1_g3211 [Rubroshorea leprosula]|uniref:Uncharacterized protein n=1 Tax=Rubroshorea leprosula TaxID=152421 RepID=A0AAV5HSW4_9ROSI|nr:hypothetical protein SLEP1_g3211 [Rubroshorea leprosula]